MTPETLDAGALLLKFAGALSVVTGAMAWWRRDSDEEDEMTALAAAVVLDAVSDADATGMVDCMTHHNWRDQLTVEQAIELEREKELCRWGKSRN